MSGIPLLIDTDVAMGVVHEGRPRDVDDGFMITAALAAPRVEVLGISTVFGNAPLTEVNRVARELVALAEHPVTIAEGADGPMSQPGQGKGEAVAFLADVLRERRAHIAAIGPLTNIGTLLKKHPEVRDNIASCVIVAGRSAGRSFMLHGEGPVNDFNFKNDVEAARVLMASGVPVVMAGFELTSQVAITPEHLQKIERAGTPIAEYCCRQSQDWMAYWRERFPGDAGFHPWDSAALAVLTNPEWFTIEQRGWRISETDEPDGFWLETSAAFPGASCDFVSGFSNSGKEAFLHSIARAFTRD